MTNKPGHSKNKPDHEKVFEQFPDHEQDDVERIWNMSSRIEKHEPGVTGNEVEEALQKVHGRLYVKDPQSSKTLWKWIAAAAVILLVFGTGFLLMPQTTTAPYGEIISHRLPDDSTVELNSGSSIEYNRLFTYINRSVQLNGEAFFSVENGDHPFTVNAGNSTIEVTGTEFNIRSWNEDPGPETEVAVSEGTVKFYPDNRRENAVEITAGFISRLSLNMDKPTLPEPVSIESIMGWRDNMLIFNDKSLSVIFSELERRFDVEIRLENDTVSHETLTIYFKENKGLESALQDICRMMGLRYSETANGYRVYK